MYWYGYWQFEKRCEIKLLGGTQDGPGSYCRLVDCGPRRDESQGGEGSAAQGHDKDLSGRVAQSVAHNAFRGITYIQVDMIIPKMLTSVSDHWTWTVEEVE